MIDPSTTLAGRPPARAPARPANCVPLKIAPAALPPGRDVRVGLVGLGFHALTIADLCGEAGLRVEFAVDDRDGRDGDPHGAAYWMGLRGIPVLSRGEFAGRLGPSPGGWALVAGRIDYTVNEAGADDSFGRAAEWVRRTAGPIPLAHPAALLERVPAAGCPGRYAVFGFPGSGNVLAQNLLDGLTAGRPAAVPTGWAMRAGLAEHFFHSTAGRVRTALAPLAAGRVKFIPHEFGTMMVSVEWADRAGVAFYVPSHRHLGLRRFHTHSRPTRPAVDYFAAAGGPSVVVVRHPLETLLSQANKIARPAQPTLDGPRFLDRTAAQLADWTRHLLANRDRVHVVRYEDMAARRIDVLRRLADRLGLPVTDGEAAALFDTYLNRNLPPSVPSHFFRGGNDKWRGEFTPAHLRRVLARLPAEAFTAFGYDVPTEGDLRPVPFAGPPAAKSELHACLLETYPLHPVPGRHGIQVTGSDARTIAALAAAFQDADLLALLDAGGLTADVRPTPACDLAAA